MSRDIFFSLVLHLGIVAATVISAPFNVKKSRFEGEIIRVSLTTLPAPAPSVEPVVIPSALPEEPANIPIDRPVTAEEAVIEEKPKTKETKPAPQATGGATNQSDRKEIESSSTAHGSPFQGATIDNASFEYPYWFDVAFNKIAGNWRNPVPYEGTLVCAVYFQVIRSGRVIELRLEQSSGVPAFDQACLLAVERSAPFPPLPRDFRDEIIGITVPFKNR